MKAVLLLLPILFVTSGCGPQRVNTSPKQTGLVDVLQPTAIALNEFQDLEIALFKGGEIPQLNPQLHAQIGQKLEIAFRTHAAAVLAVKAWQPGQPVPLDLMAFKQAIDQIVSVVKLAIPNNSPLVTALNLASSRINTIVDKGRP